MKPKRPWHICSMLALISATAGLCAARGDPFRPFFDQHCVKCHSGEKPKGDWRIDELTADFTHKESRERWESVLEQLESGEMPPKAKPRPPANEVSAVTSWIGTQVAAVSGKEGRVVLRRLNRTEYENTVNDLLGTSAKLQAMLPLDTSANGFDNVGDALHTSSFLMDQYLIAAEAALDQAIANRPKPPKLEQKRVGLEAAYQVKANSEKVFRKQEQRVVMFSSSQWVAASLFYMAERGTYRFRMSVSGVQSAGKPVAFSVKSGGGGMAGPKARLVGYFDAPADQSRVIEFTDQMEPKTSITILPYDLPNAQTVGKVGAEAWDGPGVAIDWVEMEGPLNETWPPESHRRLFGDMQQGKSPIYNQSDRVEVVSDAPMADADRILRKFARRAFRRAVTDADMKTYLDLVAAKLAEPQSFEKAIRVGLSAIMIAPEFLFLREAPGRLDASALASRLSYFLWSSTPDEELLTLAEQGKLSDSTTLRAQVERMLKSPKAAAFTTNFTGQWLSLRDLDFTMPNHIVYPHFDEMLRASMQRETELFFDEVLKDDLSIANFIASDFTMLNGRLAKHYGIDGVSGWEFQKVKLAPESHRGGLLTMASVLKVTANGTSTSPVIRGAWVLDRILGTPPKPPPENVSALEPDTRGTTTIREQLAKHRQIESCASCHVEIDPPGFALESFDVIGGYRDKYVLDGRPANFRTGKPVDPADVLPDGRAFKNIDEFKQLLLADQDQIARALATKLITYATGGPPQRIDRTKIDAIVAKAKAKNLGFRTLIHEIVASELFQRK
ncbi:MAG: DUF1592 domain-containing protein [Prosthecobacter sp.]|uniref:DUF1592 domain-containing protein n=1 Tax=Prosthecobacter sp. TaxID=1965333 RepID=UPI003902A22B